MGRTSRQSAAVASTRERILAIVRDAAEPPSAHELADELDVHVTTVRFHLDQLERTGLVAREVVRTPRRGRPTVRYRAGSFAVAEIREQMIAALADAMADRSRGGRDRAVEAGRRWALRLGITGDEPASRVTAGLTRLGFEPEPAADEIRLHACPFRDAARDNPDVVCRVHLGLAQGLADGSSSAERVRIGLVPFVEPELCLITLQQGER